MNRKKINTIREQRARRTRAKIFGTREKPRLTVFRSNRYMYCQLIDDTHGKTLAAASTHEGAKKDGTKVKQAEILGTLIAEKAKQLGITGGVFDRGAYKYHGRVKALAEGARANGFTL